MASRLGGTFYSLTGDSYAVELHDTAFGGSQYDATIENCIIKYDGEAEHLHNPILTSSCEVTFLVVDSSTEAIFETMVGAAEERFSILIEKAGSLYWCGLVVPDLVKFQDSTYPYSFTIRATDGIGRLKDIPYNDGGTDYTGWETMTGHVLNCLNKIPLTDFWGASEVYLQGNHQWWEASQGSYSATAAYQSFAFDHARVRHKTFRTVDKDGNTIYLSCYDVLKNILRAWGARMVFSAGKYVVMEVNHYRTTGPVHINQYFKDGTETSKLSNTTYEDWKVVVDNSLTRISGSADATVTSGGINTFFAPLQRVNVQYKHFSTQSLFPADNYWSDSFTTIATVEDVDSNSGNARLQISFDLRHSIDFPTESDFSAGWMKFTLLVKIDDGAGTVYYLNRQADIVNGVLTYGTAAWTLNTAHRVEFWTNTVDENEVEYLTPFSMITPPLPQDGDLSCQVAYVDLQNIFGQIDLTGSPLYAWRVTDFYCEVFYSGRIEDRSNTTVYTQAGASTNSDVLTIDTILGQGPSLNAYGAMQVQPYAGGSWYEPVTFATMQNTEAVDFGTKLAREVMYRRYDPCPKLQATLITDGTYEAHYLLFRSGPEYLFLGGTFRVFRDEWEGTWGQVDYTKPTLASAGTPADYESYNPLETVVDETIPQPIQGPPKSPPDEGFGPSYAPNTGGRNAAATIATGMAAYAADTAINEGDSVTAIEITSVSDAHNNYQFFAGDVVDIYNPFTGQRDYFDVSGYAAGTISTTSKTANYDFPAGSLVLPNYDWLINLIQALRQQVVVIPILDAATTVTTGTHNGFWRVWQNLATGFLWKVVMSVHGGGTGPGTLTIGIDINGTEADDMTISGTGSSQTVTLNYNLSGNELIEANVKTVSGFSTTPTGLVMTLIIFRQV